MSSLYRLVIISDCTDVAINEIRGAIDSNIGSERHGFVIEPAVTVVPWSVLNGAFLLRLLADAYPPRTVFYVVLNPLEIPTQRVVGVCEKKEIAFIGRNTGVFGWLAKDYGVRKLIEISKGPYVAFGGKNIYPKAVASALRGDLLDRLGDEIDPARINDVDRSFGKILHIDNFGISKISGEPSYFKRIGTKPDQLFSVVVKGVPMVTARFVNQLTAGQDGEWVIYDGSSLGGIPELAQVRMNGAYHLGLAVGDLVEFQPILNP